MRTDQQAAFSEQLPRRSLVMAILIPLLVLAAVGSARMAIVPARTTLIGAGAVADLTPVELASNAATELERAAGPGGLGYTFEVVQRATIQAHPGGPLIELGGPDGEIVEVDHVAAGTYLERGAVVPDGFFAEVLRGHDDRVAPGDDTAEVELSALVRGNETFRNDGAGWYATERPPGIGLDPVTAGLLPQMLRGLVDPSDPDQQGVEPRPSEDLSTPEPATPSPAGDAPISSEESDLPSPTPAATAEPVAEVAASSPSSPLSASLVDASWVAPAWRTSPASSLSTSRDPPSSSGQWSWGSTSEGASSCFASSPETQI
jgi:hypothetical protein